jgi:hypothetical protein
MTSVEDRPSVEWVQEKIENALHAESDQELYEKWSDLAPSIQLCSAAAVAAGLAALPEERKALERRMNRTKARKRYWNQRKHVEQLLEEIARSAIGSDGPGKQSIAFHSLDDLLCPHGWNWSHCERLGKMLISLKEETSDSNRDSLLQELTKAGIDPAKARLGEDVCAPGTRDKGSASPRYAPQPGRPRKILGKALLQTAVPCLKNGGWTNAMSFYFLAVVLTHCFGRSAQPPATLALALGRQWRNLNHSKLPT